MDGDGSAGDMGCVFAAANAQPAQRARLNTAPSRQPGIMHCWPFLRHNSQLAGQARTELAARCRRPAGNYGNDCSSAPWPVRVCVHSLHTCRMPTNHTDARLTACDHVILGHLAARALCALRSIAAWGDLGAAARLARGLLPSDAGTGVLNAGVLHDGTGVLDTGVRPDALPRLTCGICGAGASRA